MIFSLQLNNISAENLSLAEAQKQLEKTKDKLQLVLGKGRGRLRKHNPLTDEGGKESDFEFRS